MPVVDWRNADMWEVMTFGNAGGMDTFDTHTIKASNMKMSDLSFRAVRRVCYVDVCVPLVVVDHNVFWIYSRITTTEKAASAYDFTGW